jgi:hypothetical protein
MHTRMHGALGEALGYAYDSDETVYPDRIIMVAAIVG